MMGHSQVRQIRIIWPTNNLGIYSILRQTHIESCWEWGEETWFDATFSGMASSIPLPTWKPTHANGEQILVGATSNRRLSRPRFFPLRCWSKNTIISQSIYSRLKPQAFDRFSFQLTQWLHNFLRDTRLLDRLISTKTHGFIQNWILNLSYSSRPLPVTSRWVTPFRE